MRLTKEQARENRQNIIGAAGHLFSENGFDGVSVADLMKAAGFTHGGFYNHFPSKEALVAEASLSGFQSSNAVLMKILESYEGSERSALLSFIKYYLSEEHRDNLAGGCTIASLASDAARQDEQVQASFAEGIENRLEAFIPYFEKIVSEDQSGAREQAIRMMTQLVGAIIMARSVARANPSLSDEILEAVRTDWQTRL